MILLLCIWLVIGIIVITILVCREPIVLHAWFLLPFFTIIWPYVFWVMIKERNRSGWI